MSINGMTTDGDTNDVEKRWHDPAMFRAAVKYVLSVIALAGAAFTFTVVWRSVTCRRAGAGDPVLRRHRGIRYDLPGLARRRGMADLAGCGMVPATAVPGLPERPVRGGLILIG